MNIGIDIDDTITEVEEELENAAYEYAIKLGKNIKDAGNNFEDTKNNGDIYRDKFQFSYEELKYFLKDIQEEIINRAKPRVNAAKIINKLKEEGHKIVIITARDSEFHDDPYILSKNWLDKNNIEYDKLIVNAREKGKVCRNEGIDLFIDDKLGNCLDVLKEGIKVIRFSNEDCSNMNIVNLNNWIEIYNYVGVLEVTNEKNKI